MFYAPGSTPTWGLVRKVRLAATVPRACFPKRADRSPAEALCCVTNQSKPTHAMLSYSRLESPGFAVSARSLRSSNRAMAYLKCVHLPQTGKFRRCFQSKTPFLPAKVHAECLVDLYSVQWLHCFLSNDHAFPFGLLPISFISEKASVPGCSCDAKCVKCVFKT